MVRRIDGASDRMTGADRAPPRIECHERSRIMRTIIFTAFAHRSTLAAAVLAFVGCDELPEQAGDDAAADQGFWGDAADEAPADDEAPAASGLATETPESAASVVYFRLMSKQLRNTTSDTLCFEPLDNVSGSPVLQRACNNSPLSANNPQAWFQTTTLGYRIQYALKDRNSNSDLCLHIAGGAKAISDGAAAVLFPCDGTRPNQIFFSSPPDASGAIALMASTSHRCLTVFGGLDSDLALLYQFSLYAGAAACTAVHQRWYLRTDGGNYGWTNVAPEGWPAPACVL